MWRDIAYLLTINYEDSDEYGNQVKTIKKRLVYCDKMSIGSKEFYQAQATDLKPEIKIKIRTLDYYDEEAVCLEGKHYKIIRTYLNGENIELTLTSILNDEGNDYVNT